MANTPELAPRMKPSLDSETKNTAGLAPSDSLLLCLIRRSLFSFRPSFPFRLPFPPPFRHSRENGNPDRTGSPVKLGMTKNVSFPRKRESKQDWIPSQAEDDGRGWIPHQVRDDGGDGSPIRSALLSVEDDGRGWIPHQVRDDKECVIPAKAGIQTVISGSPIRSASLSVEDDKECVIPVKTGIQTGLDPQSSWG